MQAVCIGPTTVWQARTVLLSPFGFFSCLGGLGHAWTGSIKTTCHVLMTDIAYSHAHFP